MEKPTKPARPDKTRNERQAGRRKALNEVAQMAGFQSWAKLETAVLRGDVEIAQKDPPAIVV